MAVSLTEEMQQAINSAFDDCFPIVWSSVGTDGQPVLSFFGTTQAYSDHEIAIWGTGEWHGSDGGNGRGRRSQPQPIL
jgi:hypothetical protein